MTNPSHLPGAGSGQVAKLPSPDKDSCPGPGGLRSRPPGAGQSAAVNLPRGSHNTLTIDVIGTPAPQGSKRHVGNGILVESSRAVAPWRTDVALQVSAEIHRTGWTIGKDIPLFVELTFRLHRPAAAKKRTYPYTSPDVDKLARSTLDALTTCGAIGDDSRIVTLTATKRYAEPGEPTGATITITQATA